MGNDINEKKSVLPSYYLIKRVINIAAILFYVVGGIVMLTLIPTLNTLQPPWIELTRISVLALILSGIGLFILATAPVIATLLLMNMEKPMHNATSRQARWELAPAMVEEEIVD